MEHSMQHTAHSSDQELIERLPEGYPPVREHLNDPGPLTSDLQKRLDRIEKENLGECPPGSQAAAYRART